MPAGVNPVAGGKNAKPVMHRPPQRPKPPRRANPTRPKITAANSPAKKGQKINIVT